MNSEINCKLLREITPLTQSDCFSVFSRNKKEFDFPLHFHEEIELNFINYGLVPLGRRLYISNNYLILILWS